MIKFIKRQSIVPFDTTFAFFCIYSGMISVFRIGIVPNIFRDTLGERISSMFDIGYALAGLLMFIGIGLGRRDVQAAGLITVITSITIRCVLIGWLIGFNSLVFNTYVFNIAFIIAC